MKDIDNEFSESFKNDEIDIGKLFKIIFATCPLESLFATLLGFIEL